MEKSMGEDIVYITQSIHRESFTNMIDIEAMETSVLTFAEFENPDEPGKTEALVCTVVYGQGGNGTNVDVVTLVTKENKEVDVANIARNWFAPESWCGWDGADCKRVKNYYSWTQYPEDWKYASIYEYYEDGMQQ